MKSPIKTFLILSAFILLSACGKSDSGISTAQKSPVIEAPSGCDQLKDLENRTLCHERVEDTISNFLKKESKAKAPSEVPNEDSNKEVRDSSGDSDRCVRITDPELQKRCLIDFNTGDQEEEGWQ